MTHRLLYAAAFSSALLAAGAMYAAAELLDVPVKVLTRDPYRAAEVPPYFAYFSLLGSTIWLIAGTATLTTAVVAARVLGCRLRDAGPYRLVLLGGMIGLLMALDDILLFHDAVARAIGIPEILFLLFYILAIGAMILYSRAEILSTPWIVLLAALACFGLSGLIDLWRSLPASLSQSEDVFKICAVILWAFYFLYLSWSTVTAVPSRAPDQGRDSNLRRSSTALEPSSAAASARASSPAKPVT